MSEPSASLRPSEPDLGTSRVTRFGTVVGAGLLAAAFAALPAELRIGGMGSVPRAGSTWLVLTALALPLGVLAALVFRRARVGLRHLTTDGGAQVLLGACVWIAGELLLLSMFGAVLRAHTHHHGLAGATFAIFALLSALAMAVVAARLVRSLRATGASVDRLAVGVGALVVFALLVFAGGRGTEAPDLPTSAWLIDALSLAAVAAVASSPSFARARFFALVSVPVAAGLLLLGVTLIRMDPVLRESVASHAPMHARIMDTLAH